ncbi:MAG: NAD(P)/FAD-dependent oxidoreductase [Polyangiales bacterium]
MDRADDRPWSRTAPAQRWDYIIVGSGMGGMTTAAILAKLGKRVLVLERHYVPGGFTHAFKRKRWHWDVGVHAIGEVTRRDVVGRILADLAGDRLQWASLGAEYEHFEYPGGFKIAFPDNQRQYRENLYAAFPDERETIDRYFAEVRRAVTSMGGYYLSRVLPESLGTALSPLLMRSASKYTDRTLAEVLDGLTKNPKLRTVLAGQWGYYGSPPSQGSFAIHAGVVHHFFHGAHYPVGGAGNIARALLRTVADAGGWTRIRAEVDQVLIEGGAAVGVRMKDGEEIRAGRVVCATNARVTAEQLIPPEHLPRAWSDAVRSMPPSPAHLCLYMGFEGDITKEGAGAANQWFWETWDPELTDWDFATPGTPPPLLYTSYPSLKDPAHDPGPSQLHTGEIVTFVPYDAFERWRGTPWMKRGAEYEALKEDLKSRLLAQFFKHRPGLEPLLRHAELSTPLTTEHFANPAAGGIYGVVSTPARYRNPWLRPRTPIRNLFLSGCDVGAAGVIGAFAGGLFCALSAEPAGVVPYLLPIVAKR